ncbi:hypothetical protein LIER_36077 [Lithospermum erythrorhizon]|uniref:Retrovirus-related Pol polyprotein from transposon TNT 1-94-like beta-barrel domain-containing protein n=1 Tax=Lithospermum erythrorhizon TaxID=34254 RepID=A0AAV3P4E3_LITER
MRLGEEYDVIRNQILLMDPLSYVAKTYSMVSEVEKRRVVKGHVNFDCFRIVRYPKWWGNKTGSGTGGGVSRTRCVNVNNVEYQDDGIENTPLNHAEEVVNFTEFGEFAGNLVASISNDCVNMLCGSWIEDSGASVHVCSDIKLFDSITNMSYNTFAKLLDNTVKVVKSGGNVKLSNNMILVDCFYVPTFNYNLLLVRKIRKIAQIIFLPEFCLLQDT